MSNGWQFSNTPAARVLKAIQVRGKASIKDVAGDLGVTASAVRQHLAQLEASGAVRAVKIREGVGRPYYLYSVTPEGHNLFHKDYGELARLLLSLLLDEVGRSGETGGVEEMLGRLSGQLEWLRVAGVPFTLSMCVMQSNVCDLPGLVDWAAEVGAANLDTRRTSYHARQFPHSAAGSMTKRKYRATKIQGKAAAVIATT